MFPVCLNTPEEVEHLRLQYPSGLVTYWDCLQERLVEIVGDSQAAGANFRKGGSQRADLNSDQLELFEAFLDIMRTGLGLEFLLILFDVEAPEKQFQNPASWASAE